MSQDYDLPLLSTGTPSADYLKINDAFDALLTTFSGATAPSSPVAGQLWRDTTTNTLQIYNGAAWVVICPDLTDTSGGIVTKFGSLAGLQMADDLDFDGNLINNLGAAVATGDAVNKGQVDAKTLSVSSRIGTVSATGVYTLFAAPSDMTVFNVTLLVRAATTSTGSNYWSINLRNVTQAVDLMSTAFSSNGSDFAVDTAKILSLDQNLAPNAADVLQLQLTKNGTATNLSSLVAILNYGVAV